jgi:hypothetical protein
MDDLLHLLDNSLVRELFVSVKFGLRLSAYAKRPVFKKVYNTGKPGTWTYFSMVFSSSDGSIGAFSMIKQNTEMRLCERGI